MTSETFLQKTQSLYKNRPGGMPLRRIIEKTGLRVKWLKDFPKIHKADKKMVELLYAFLAPDPINDVIDHDDENTLHNKTIDLINGRPRGLTLEDISEDTGLSLGWLKAMYRVENPSVNLIETLYNYLSPRPLSFE